MNEKTLYTLAGHAAVEPLVNQWVAWPHVFSPVPYSLHMANYQTRTLASYLQSPELHVKSSRNPKMLGGPFVDIGAERAGEVGALLSSIEQEHQDILQLGKSLFEFQKVLAEEAEGQGLNPYYEKIPEPLGGYVELNYDYFNNPVVRCLESVFYASPYYKENLQSLRLFSQARDDSRAYYMSTPRLPKADEIEWKIPFSSERVDALFGLDEQPQPLGHIREVLGLSPADDGRLLPLLSAASAARQYDAPPGHGLRIRYCGHASVLVEWNGVAILIDPFIPVIPKEGGVGRFTFGDLPARIDYVLITHGHHDHFVFESLLRLRRRIGCLVVPKSSGIFYGDVSLKLMAQKLGFKNVVEIDALESIPFPGGEIIGSPFLGEHSDLPHAKSGYIIKTGKKLTLFAADSNCLDKRLYQHVRKALGPIETVFLGMECIGAPLSWVYGPLLPVQPQHSHNLSRRSNGSDSKGALNLLDAVGAERVYIYAIGREPWLKYFMALTPEDNDPYIKESNIVLEAARQKGFKDAQRPFGKMEVNRYDC